MKIQKLDLPTVASAVRVTASLHLLVVQKFLTKAVKNWLKNQKKINLFVDDLTRASR
jgi:hypothetical protein